MLDADPARYDSPTAPAAAVALAPGFLTAQVPDQIAAATPIGINPLIDGLMTDADWTTPLQRQAVDRLFG